MLKCWICKGHVVTLEYAQAWVCIECLGKERDSLITKQERIKAVIIEWKKKQGHDKCHWFPELFNKIAEILEIDERESEDNLPSEEEFEAGCNKFRSQLYNKLEIK